MFWWTEVFCDRRPLEPLVFPIISVAVHPLVHMITGFTNILFSTLGACYKVDNIGRLTTGVALKLDCCPRRKHFHGSSRGTVVKVSSPETIFMAKVYWRYWHKVVARPRDFDSFPRRSQQFPPEHKVYGWNFNQAARVSGHQIKSCGRYNICWSVYKTNRYTPVSPTHKLPPETLLQKCSLQPCTSPQTYLLRFGHLWIKSKRTDWPPLQTGLSETGNFTCHWGSTATKERRPTFL